MNGDGTAHELYQFVGDGKAQARTAKLSTDVFFSLLETVENKAQFIFRNADPCIGHAEFQPAGIQLSVFNFHSKADLPFFSEFNRITAQIQKNLIQAHLITSQQIGQAFVNHKLQIQLLFFGEIAHHLFKLPQQFFNGERLAVEIHFIGLNLTQIEQVVDEPQ